MRASPARGVVFAIVEVFFAYAGFRVDAQQSGSTGDALARVRQLPFGAVLYLAVAIGLGAFGVYNLIEARYRIVRGPSFEELKHSIPTP
ncbi:hypothetical protein FHT92_005052 [Rhizobium sp. BK377]|nr:hypothetical protein [Rhizobium sp. BK377]